MSVSSLTQLIQSILPEPHAGLLAGMLFGVKSGMSSELYEALVATGTLHIVALSGTNISIIMILIAGTVQKYFSRRVTSLLTIIVIGIFVFFVGPSPSVVRASIMGSLSLLSIVLGRRNWGLWGLFIASITMLAFKPGLIIDVSFQLSVGATLGMMLFYSSKKVKLPRLLGVENIILVDYQNGSKYQSELKIKIFNYVKFGIQVLYDNFRLTLAAQTFTIPLILIHFHRMSLISPVPNMLIGFILPPLTGLGFMTVGLALLFRPLGQMFAWVAWVFLEYIVLVVEIFSKIPFSNIKL